MNTSNSSLPCTFAFALEVMDRLAREQCVTWLHGGWAEELWFRQRHHLIAQTYQEFLRSQ